MGQAFHPEKAPKGVGVREGLPGQGSGAHQGEGVRESAALAKNRQPSVEVGSRGWVTKKPRAPCELYTVGTAWQLGITESWVSQSASGAWWIRGPMRRRWVTELLAALPRSSVA